MTTRHRGHLSSATKAKISAALKGKHHPGRKGHKLSTAAKAKISAALKGKHHKGHPLSTATKAKISAALKGKHRKGHPLSAAARAKISAALKGRTHKGHAVSAAARAKISAALKNRVHKARVVPATARHHAVKAIKASASRARGVSAKTVVGKHGLHVKVHFQRISHHHRRPTGVRIHNPLPGAVKHHHLALNHAKRVQKRHALAQFVHHHRSFRPTQRRRSLRRIRRR